MTGRDAATAAFLDGTARGQFLLRRCRPGRHVSGPQFEACHACGSTDLEHVPASGHGQVVSWTVVHSSPARTLVIVQLDEGPWWWSTLVDADPGSVRTGMEVRIDYQRPDGSPESIPIFRPVQEGA
jgi:uncharacterized OB-fold protein